jgi:ribonuclease HII
MANSRACVGGIDEAGRGSIIGPLVVAGVSATLETLKQFEEMGVKDSKMLTAAKRESLYDEIVLLSNEVHFATIEIDEIDQYVWFGTRRRKLNFLEAMHMAKVIPHLAADEVYVDAPDTNPGMFTVELSQMVELCPRIVAQHRADRDFVIVSAASIIAKVERDKAIELLRGEHGDFGSGYPSDRHTVEFLKDWVRREGSRPHFARKSWKTWDRVLTETLDP